MARKKKPNIAKALLEQDQERPIWGEIGSTGVNPFNVFFSEEAYYFAQVPIESLEKMMDQDGQAMALFRLITMPIRAGQLKVTPVDGGATEADFIRTVLTKPYREGGLRFPWSFVMSCLCRAIITGTECLEKVYEERNGYVILDKLAYRPRRTYIILQDIQGNFLGIRQRLPTGQVDIPAEKLVHYIIQPEFNPLYGKSMFLPAYYHYEKKHKLYYVQHLAYALNAIPIRVGSYPLDAPTKDKLAFQNAISQIGVNTSIIKPEGFNLEFPNTNGTVSDALPMIDHHDIMMSKAVLGQMIDLGTSDNGGSYALSENHLSMFLLSIEALMKEFSDLVNSEIIPDLIDWNFGSSRYPVVTIEPAYTDRRIVIQSIFEKMVAAKQVNFSPEFAVTLEKAMAEQLGFTDIDYDAQFEEFVNETDERQRAQNGQTDDELQQQTIDQQGDIADKQIQSQEKTAKIGAQTAKAKVSATKSKSKKKPSNTK